MLSKEIRINLDFLKTIQYVSPTAQYSHAESLALFNCRIKRPTHFVGAINIMKLCWSYISS